MTEQHPFDLTNQENRAVFEYIKNLSAHSDLVEPLVEAVKPLGDVQIFTPERPGGYGYYTVSTRGIIFGFVIGTQCEVYFRLDPIMKQRALATGGIDFSECGPNWVTFKIFRGDWPEPDLEFWARKAYVYIRENIP